MPVTLTTNASARINGQEANLRRIRGEQAPEILRRQHTLQSVELVKDELGLWFLILNGGDPNTLATDVEVTLWKMYREAQP